MSEERPDTCITPIRTILGNRNPGPVRIFIQRHTDEAEHDAYAECPATSIHMDDLTAVLGPEVVNAAPSRYRTVTPTAPCSKNSPTTVRTDTPGPARR